MKFTNDRLKAWSLRLTREDSIWYFAFSVNIAFVLSIRGLSNSIIDTKTHTANERGMLRKNAIGRHLNAILEKHN